jgi:hypothetical protein
VAEALKAGLDGSHPLALQAKMLRVELLNVKADLERELGRLVLDCSKVRPAHPLGVWSWCLARRLGSRRARPARRAGPAGSFVNEVPRVSQRAPSGADPKTRCHDALRAGGH